MLNEKLSKRYPLIVATGRMYGSVDAYINEQLNRAVNVDAPGNTTCVFDKTVSTSEDYNHIENLKILLTHL